MRRVAEALAVLGFAVVAGLGAILLDAWFGVIS